MKLVVGVVGGVLTLAGLALLPLPGPGFLLVAAGLAVLASRFSWAKKPLDYARARVREGIDQIATKPLHAVSAVASAAVVLGLGVVELSSLDLPLVSAWTAPLLIASGLVLIGVVVYARQSETPRAE
jgi:uncharacterized protein (TIGR02611 family)